MSRQLPLTTVAGGITRLRTKGAAINTSLYDLLNGYVSAARTVVVRPGTVRTAQLPDTTKGLCSFDGKFHVFSHEVVSVPTGYVLHVLQHPEFTNADGSPITIKEIHFAEPFLGFLYVVVEFEVANPAEESVYHFWLQSGGVWEASKVYKAGDIVEPTTPNGLAYQATRLGSPSPSWAANTPRSIGDVVEPTTYNDFFYTVVDAEGVNPTSGATEPDWIAEPGAHVFEDTEITPTPPPVPTETPTLNLPGIGVVNRYGGPGALFK